MSPLSPQTEAPSVPGTFAGSLPEVTADSVRAQLEKILASEAFFRSERLRGFLRLIVEQTLDGEAGNPKEYTVGVDVYDRGPLFDPTVDPIVRVEARRLRVTLQKYYETEGSSDAVWIDIPRGRYAARFRDRRSATADRSPARSINPATSIVVLPFENLGPGQEQDCLCDGVTEELISRLTRVQGLRVVARTTAFALKHSPQDVRKIGQELRVGTLVEGTVRSFGPRLRITARIVNVNDGYHLWSERFDFEKKDMFAIQDEIARTVAARVEQTMRSEVAGGVPLM